MSQAPPPPSLQDAAGRLLRPSHGTALALLVAGTFFMENLDGSVLTPALPRMAETYRTVPEDLSAAVSAYMLALGIGIPLSGWMADRFGSRRVFSSAILLFTLASALCGLAPTLGWFVAFRVLQGIGGAMMVPVGRLVVLRTTPKENLVGVIATLTWPALVAPVLGPPLGGFLVKVTDWRWIFYLNLPLGVIALIAALLLTRNDNAQERKPFDFLGFALLGGASACLLWTAESLGSAHASGASLAAFAAAGAALLFSGIHRMRTAAHPLVDLSTLREPTFAVTVWGGTLFRMGVSAVPFLTPLLLQTRFGYDPFHAGSMLMAVFAGNLLMKPWTTAVLRRFGFRRTLIGNGLIHVATIAACAFFHKETPVAAICAVLFVSGLTRSMQFTAINTIAFADVPQPLMSSANTLFSTVSQLGFALGIALGAVLLRGAERPPLSALGNPFAAAFLGVAVISALGLADCVKLRPDVGAGLIKPAPSKTTAAAAADAADPA